MKPSALFLSLACLAAPAWASRPALEGIDMNAAATYRISPGACTDCAAPAQALWYFQGDRVAAPRTAPGYDPTLSAQADAAAHAAADVQAGTPLPLIWLGATQRLDGARLRDDRLLTPDGRAQPLKLVPRLASNRAWFDASSAAYFQERTVRARGETDAAGHLVARALWPEDWHLNLDAPLRPAGRSETPRNLVRAQGGGFESRVLWERQPGGARNWGGKAALGVMLNGAQGDDDEAHGGHFALATGRVGAQGEMADWLVHNFYNLDIVSEKGIVAAPTPMDAYLTDLNSGQQWYRPSWMVVAVLKDGQGAALTQAALGRVYGHFYRHDFTYNHARDNCTSISVDVLRGLGWNLPERGPTSRVQALAGYAYAAARDGSLRAGRKLYDYLSTEQTRLYPAVAFEALADDLGRLSQGRAGRALTPFERQLGEDVEAILLVRIPQIPSSRAWGQAPVFSFDEYRARVPAEQKDWEIVPVPDRPFPARFQAKTPEQPAPVPLPVAGVFAGVLGLGGWHLRRRKSRASA